MPSRRFITEQNSFVGGELGPELYSRYDLAIYYQAAAKLENIVVQPQGGIKNRPGERYLDRPTGMPSFDKALEEVKNGDLYFIPFLFSNDERYLIILRRESPTSREYVPSVVELHDGDGVPHYPISYKWCEPPNNTGPTDANLCLLYDTGFGWWQWPTVRGSNQTDVAMLDADSTEAEVYKALERHNNDLSRGRNTNLKLRRDFTKGASDEVAPDIERPVINWEQYGDVLFLTGDLETVYVIRRTLGKNDSHPDDDIHGFTFFSVEAYSASANAGAGVGAGVSLPFVTNTWNAFDVGRNADNQGRNFWGLPRCQALHGGRMWLAGFNDRARRNTIIGSKAGDLSQFNLDDNDPLDDDALEISLRTRSNEPILHLVSANRLLAFTSTDEWAIPETTITHSNAFFVEQSSFGCHPKIKPIEQGDNVVFIQHGGNTVYQMTWTGEDQQYNVFPITERFPNNIKDPISMSYESGFSADAGNRLYIVNGDGVVKTLTTLVNQQVLAWSTWPTIKNEDGTELSLVLTMATVGDDTFVVRALDTSERPVHINVLDESRLFASSMLTDQEQRWTDAPDDVTIPLSIYNHTSLESQRNYNFGPVLPPDPTYSFSDDGAEVGLDLPVKIVTLPLNPTYQQKNTQYRLKRVIRLFVETLGAHTLDATYLRTRPFNIVTEQRDQDGIFFLRDGTVEKRFYGYRRNADITFTQPKPGPLHINGYALEIQTAFVPPV